MLVVLNSVGDILLASVISRHIKFISLMDLAWLSFEAKSSRSGLSVPRPGAQT